MTNTEITIIVDRVVEVLKPHAIKAAKDRADEVLGHVLGTDEETLRFRARQAIEKELVRCAGKRVALRVDLVGDTE